MPKSRVFEAKESEKKRSHEIALVNLRASSATAGGNTSSGHETALPGLHIPNFNDSRDDIDDLS